jgi:hypothetical protein
MCSIFNPRCILEISCFINVMTYCVVFCFVSLRLVYPMLSGRRRKINCNRRWFRSASGHSPGTSFVPGLYQRPPGSCQFPSSNLRRRLSCISQHQQSGGHSSSTKWHFSTTTMGVRLANDVPPRKMYYHPHFQEEKPNPHRLQATRSYTSECLWQLIPWRPC